ncbi:MAG TPA: DUF3566 domain-containing protein [Actinomycetota bacterium]|nr:DUF3566 domain-containing protein [Actinomycetota bacterium]
MRRVKRVVRHIDPVSVLRLSLFYSVCFLVIWLIVVAGIYYLVNSRGLFDALEELSDGLALGWNLDITLWWVERWAFLIGLTVGVLGSLMSVFVVFLYNIAADLLGGVEMTHVERDM